MHLSNLKSFVSVLKFYFLSVLSIAMTVVILSAPPLATAQGSQSETEIHIVLDIDWTLANPTTEKMAQADPSGIIRVDGEIYRISESAIDVLIALHEIPGAKISFFSGGSTERNEFLIKKVYEMVDKVVGSSKYRPHLILSKDQMRQVSDDPTLKFHERYKKDLAPFFDLNQTLLFDDVLGFTPKGQERNLIWTGKTYNDRIRFDLDYLEDPTQKSYKAPNFTEWQRDRQKLIRFLGIVLEAQERAHVNKISFVDAAQEVLILEALSIEASFDTIQRVSKEKRFNTFRCSAKFQ